jgi:hypothetical protein
MQASNSRSIGRSPDSIAGKLPLRASAEFVGGHKQVAGVLSMAQPLLGKPVADLDCAPYALLLGLTHRQSLTPFAASWASSLGADWAIRQ